MTLLPTPDMSLVSLDIRLLMLTGCMFALTRYVFACTGYVVALTGCVFALTIRCEFGLTRYVFALTRIRGTDLLSPGFGGCELLSLGIRCCCHLPVLLDYGNIVQLWLCGLARHSNTIVNLNPDHSVIDNKMHRGGCLPQSCTNSERCQAV